MTTKKVVKKEKEIVSLINIEKFTDYIYDRTVEWGKEFGMYPKGIKEKIEDSYSDKGKKIIELIKKSDFGCQKENVRLLLQEVIGEELPELDSNKKMSIFIKNICLFISSNPEGKNYPVGEVIMIVGNISSENAVTSENKKITLLIGSASTYSRIPTKNEIADFLEQLGVVNIHTLFFN